MNFLLKFTVQILASVFMIYFSNTVLLSFGDLLSSGPINLGISTIPVTIFCTMGIINAINMLDGLDGLAGGVSLLALISFSVLAFINNQMELMLLSIALSGAVLGFLKYNWYPSKLFLGDAGSYSLGFVLAFLSIAITQKDNSLVPPMAPLLILAVPIVDTITIMLKRGMKGKNPFRADKYHLHHILLRFGLDIKEAVTLIIVLSMIFSLIAIIGTILKIPNYYMFLIFSIYFISYFVSSFYIKQILRFKFKLKKKKMSEDIDMGEPVTNILHIHDNTKERRKQVRHEIILSFSCRVNGNGRVYSTKSLNIGVGGFSAQLNTFIPKNETMNLTLFLSENGKRSSLFATAGIAWTCKKENFYIFGFKFINMDATKRNYLKDYLDSFVHAQFEKR